MKVDSLLFRASTVKTTGAKNRKRSTLSIKIRPDEELTERRILDKMQIPLNIALVCAFLSKLKI